MARGKVKWFSATKGYGFLEDSNVRGDIMVHHTVIEMKGYRSLNEGDAVEYTLDPAHSKPRAKTCKKI